MSSVADSVNSSRRVNLAELIPLKGELKKVPFEEMPQLLPEPTQAELDAQLAKQNQIKVHAVFQVNGKIIGNVLENGWTEFQKNADAPHDSTIWDNATKRGLSGAGAADYLTEKITAHLRQRYPGLQVITFDSASAPTSGEYHERVLSGGSFNKSCIATAGNRLNSSLSYDAFKSLFLQED